MTIAFRYAGPDRRRARPSPLMIGLALVAVAAIVAVTLCPIGLRPHAAPANIERFGAFAVTGALVSLARGRGRLSALAIVIALALGLEAAQGLAPGRHAAAADALIKALGGVAGCFVGQLAFPVRRLLSRLGERSAAPAPATIA